MRKMYGGGAICTKIERLVEDGLSASLNRPMRYLADRGLVALAGVLSVAPAQVTMAPLVGRTRGTSDSDAGRT